MMDHLQTSPSRTAAEALERLDRLVTDLLDPVTGCPWDREQTPEGLTEDLLEEMYELREALLAGDGAEVLAEGGDTAFNLILLSRLAEKKWSFGFREMLDAVRAKMIARHPHVFGDVSGIKDTEDVLAQWHRIKRSKSSQGVLASVPAGMPALMRCHRLSAKAARSGFDWPDPAEVRQALDRELAELDAEIALGRFQDPDRRQRLMEEMGDVLMAAGNLARHLGFSGEKALALANGRFEFRFNFMEKKLAEKNLRPEDVPLDELEKLWQEAKKI
ncbi:MAG: nucleoside triphosphate pyrophosphohydrolase [Deltaproteobacteria bacterium]|jgi:MazG family protein|nr:nucleoside triphosphate pyrophosphohydrolase [Deltaproteobacteria bacterium]